jgi:PAS domain S-box-containing protein
MKVLLLEDHEGFAVIVREMLHSLRDESISFEWVTGLDQGIARLTQWVPDVILLDLSLPDSCGLETLCEVRQHAGAAPIIVLTGNDDENIAIKAISQGAQDYLVKGDIDRRGFVRAIRYAIERKKNELRLERHRHKQSALHELNLAITSTLDLQSVLHALVEKIGKFLPKLAVTFWLPVNDLGDWEAVACWNLDENYWRPFWKGSASGLLKAVVGAGHPIVIENLANDPRVSNPELILRNKLVSHLGVPLRFKDELLGVINFFSREAGQFDSEEVEFLTTLAGQVAVAIYNSRSFERAQTQAASLENAYHEISAAQRKYAELMETINAIVWEADPVTWQITFVSKVAEEILGYPLERWLNTPDFWTNHLLHPDDRNAAISRCLNEIALGNDHELEYRAVAADGRAVWLRDTIRVIKDESGTAIRLRGVLVDITKSKEAEEKQQKHYHEIQSLQEVSQRVLNSGDVRDAIEKILDMAVELGGYDIGSIRLLSPADGYNHVILRGYHDPESMRAILNHRVARPRDERWRNQARVISTRETHVFEDIQIHEGFPVFKREGVRSVIMAPIAMDDEAIGVLQVGNRRITKFQPDQVKLLETLASQIGIVLQKAKLYEEIRAHLAHIQSMRQIEQAMVSTLSLDDVLRVLLDKIESVFSFKVVIAAQLLKPNSLEFGTIVCRNIDTDLWRREHERHLPINQSGLVREVLNSLTSLQILRLEDDPRVRHREFKRAYGLISYLGIPLRVAEQPVGVLDIITTTEHEFSEQEVSYLASLASHAAIAIQNARLYSELGKKSQKLSALLAVTAAASQSLEMERILQQVIRKISEIFGFDAMRVCLFDDQKEILHARATYETHPDFSTPSRNFKKGQGITGTVGATGEAIVISDIETDPRYEMLSHTKTALKLGHKLLAGFPIKYKGETLGVITCIGRHSRQLAVDEIQLIASMSSQIAIAIHNARLYAEVEKQSRELSALFDVSATASQSLDMDRVLGEAAQKITEIFGFDATRTFLFDDQGEELHALASFASHPEFTEGPRSFKKGQGITGTVGVTGQAIIIGDVQSAPDFQALRQSEDISEIRYPHNFLAAFPVKYKEDTLGVILCVGRSARQLTVHEILLITAMTRQIAIAVHNARLYAEVEKQSRELAALFDVTSTASQSLETKQILRQVAQKINEIFNFDATRVFLFDESKRELHAEATHERDADFASGARRFKRGQGITGHVGNTGEAIIIGNIDTDPRYPALSYTKTAVNTQQKFLAGFPIKYKEETLGVITCVGRQPRELAAHEIQLITSMSNQIAVALENARYYEQTKKQAVQLRNYANRQEAVLEQERTRISREIHDELGQALTAMKLDLSLLFADRHGNDREIAGKISELSSALDGTIQSIRKIATRLRPDLLDKLGLIPAIEWQLQEFRMRSGIRYLFAAGITELRLNDEQSTTLFRILQEALTNVARHARANRVKVSLELQANDIELRVEDDGVGIDAEKLVDPNSLGLLGMRERAGALNGSVTIHPGQPKGTTVIAILPYRCPAEKVDISGSRAS